MTAEQEVPMAHRPPARRERFLDVSVRLGRHTILQAPSTRVQVLVDVRPVADIVGTVPDLEARLVVDRSGSMDMPIGPGDPITRLEAIKPALVKFVQNLGDADKAMLVTFSEDFQILQQLAHMRPHRIHSLVGKILSMTTLSNTRFAEAMEAALAQRPSQDTPTCVILFTDGNSTCHQVDDYRRMVELADKANALGIPLLIYGTGDDYNWEFLQQLAVRAGNGSFCKHVLDMNALEGQLIGELAFQRGVTVEGLSIEGASTVGQIVSVTHFMPTQVELPDLMQVDPSQPRPRDFFRGDRFFDATGNLDHFRGQQILIEMDVPEMPVGTLELIRLTIKGTVIPRGLLRFSESVTVPITVTDDQNLVPTKADAEIKRVMRMMAARKAAEKEQYDRAAQLYRRAGDVHTADTMHTLHQMSVGNARSREDLRRESMTQTGFATSMTMTVLPEDISPGRRRSRRSDTDSTPTEP